MMKSIPKSCFIRCQLNFSDIHESMNAMGAVKANVSLTLHSTYCVHTTMNVRKMKFISKIRAVTGLRSSPELRFANKTKMFSREEKSL